MVQAPDPIEMVHTDLPHALQLLDEMNVSAQQVATLVDDMLAKVRTGELSTDQGLSFLEMKYHMLLSYLINLTFVVLRKCSGERIDGDPCIDRLVEIRAVLEKIRPIEHKLHYQIDKLVKTAVHGVSANDPLLYAPHPENMTANTDDEEESHSDQDGGHADDVIEDNAQKKQVYVPPKIASVHYPDERGKKQHKKSLSAALLEELRDEYLDTPLEVAHDDRTQQKMSKAAQERQKYEEEYLTRLPMAKKEKEMRGRQMALGDELTDFGEDGGAMAGGSRRRKRNKKAKSQRSKRRRFH